MTKRPLKNVSASVHQRLLNRAKEAGRPFNELLQYYAMERFLYRLSVSRHAERFVLKGALMLTLWRAPITRPTRDIDLLGRMDNSPESVAGILRDVCDQEVEDDGLAFDPATVQADVITQAANYRGVRVRFLAHLGDARVGMQVDVGFGDVVYPQPGLADYPTMLDYPAPRLLTYSRESVVAEKAHAMVKLGELNSRLRDFYDMWLLSRQFDFSGERLAEAIRRTFAARSTEAPAKPAGLRDAFAAEARRQAQWQALCRRLQLADAPDLFAKVVESVRVFLEPVLRELADGSPFRGEWHAPGPWQRDG